MTAEDPIELAALVTSRVCHDLLNSAGAIGNALELLDAETDSAMRGDCLSLLRDSAAGLTTRLRFFRLAFGGAGAGPVDADQVVDVIEALAALNPRLKATTRIAASALTRPRARLLLCLTLVGVESLPRGGTLEVVASDDGLGVVAEGLRVLVDDATLATLRGAPLDAPAAKAAAARLAALVAGQEALTLEIEGPADGRLSLAAR